MDDAQIKLLPVQDKFLFSKAKFPAFFAGVGVGKTFLLLLKAVRYGEQWPGSTILILRKEYTSLRDSTIADFQKYFHCSVGSDKNFKMPNGSIILFRHGDEMPVIKNLSAGFIGIEQIDEFETDETFQMCRDRLRQDNGADVLPLCVVGNACGHGWQWKRWIASAQTVNAINPATNEFEYIGGEYHAITASSFANEVNLRPDFIADLRRKEKEAPSFYRRFILSNWDEAASDDQVFSYEELMKARNLVYSQRVGYGTKLFGVDISRFGDDKTCMCGLVQLGALHWSQYFIDEWDKTDLASTTGKVIFISNKQNADKVAVDEDGLGSGVVDNLVAADRNKFEGFRNKSYGKDENPDFGNRRSEAIFKVKDLISEGHLILTDDLLIQELLGLRYKFTPSGQRILISKDEMRREGIASPNRADSLLMAVNLIDDVQRGQDRQYAPRHPTVQPDNWNPFAPIPQTGSRRPQYY